VGLFGGKDKKIETTVQYVDGITGVSKNAPCRATLEEDFIIVDEVTLSLKGMKPIKTFKIPNESIISVEIVNEENIKEKNKSVVGRGVAGGVIFGPIGIMLGGLSGVGTKQEKEKIELLCISYVSSTDNEIKTIVLKQYPSKFDAYNFVKAYKKMHPNKEQEDKEIFL